MKEFVFFYFVEYLLCVRYSSRYFYISSLFIFFISFKEIVFKIFVLEMGKSRLRERKYFV